MSVTPYGFISPRVVYEPALDVSRVVARRTIALIPEDAIMLRGTLQVPRSGVKLRTMVSAQGVVFSDRISLQSLNDDSWASFVADDEFWDNTSGIWTPIRSSSPVLYQLVGNPGAYPAITETQYRVNKELIVHDAMRFDDQTMSTDFDDGFDDATNFTLAMALFPLDQGPNEIITFSDGSTVSITPTGLEGVMDDKTWTVTIPSGPMRLGPLYLILELKPPVGTLYAGYSPGVIYKGSSVISRNTTKQAFTLSSPMYLFALDIWGDGAPAASEIVARYSSALGSTDSPIGVFA